MSTFLYDLGRWCYNNRRRVVAIWIAILVALGGLAGVLAKSYDDNFSIPGAQSQDALNKLKATFPQAAALSAMAIVVLPEGQSVDDPAVKTAIEKVVKGFEAGDKVEGVSSPYSELVTGLISKDKRSALIQLQLEGKFENFSNADRESLQNLTKQLSADLPQGSTLNLGGEAFSVDIPGLSPIEALGLVIALIVLLVTLGSLRAAGMPLITAIIGVGAAMAIITIATGIAPINSTTPMLTVMLGLAVGIDYALFIVSRHRDQLGQGMDAEESTARAVATAGSAVVFAGLTVVIALVGLALAGIPFLTVMGAFAAVAVAIAVLIALTLLPAMLGFAGAKLTPKPRKLASKKGADRGGIFGWWVRTVTKIPLLTIGLVILALGALAFPAKDLAVALPNSGTHSPTAPDRITYDLIADRFGPGYNGPLIVTVDLLATNDPLGVMKAIKADIEAMPGVEAVPVSTPNQNADTGFVQVVPTTAPDDKATGDLVRSLLDKADHWRSTQGVNTAVTGSTAIQLDVSDKLFKALLPFGLFVAGLSLVLLTMVFRSIAVPIKATLGFVLSVGAAFGATNIVFNRGFGAEIINLERVGPVISFLPIIAMGILFGLAMDYEVFLVSRIREEYVHGKSAKEAVESGFIASGKVVTAAALIMFAVFAFFVPEGKGPIKAIGFALAVGVAIDAFIVRMTLVPAVLAMLGDKAWTLPKWLDKVLPSFDVEGESLNHQLSLADWPSADHKEALHVEDLAAPGVFAPITASLQPGEVGVVVGESGARTAALLALTGRLSGLEGRARVVGQLLPEQAGKVRRDTHYVDLSNGIPLADQLATITPGERLVVIDGVDSLTEAVDLARIDQLIARTKDAAANADSGKLPMALILGVSDDEQAARWTSDGVLHITRPETPADDTPARDLSVATAS